MANKGKSLASCHTREQDQALCSEDGCVHSTVGKVTPVQDSRAGAPLEGQNHMGSHVTIPILSNFS